MKVKTLSQMHYPDGTLMSEEIQVKKSPPTTVERIYYPNGKLQEESTCVNGELHGVRRVWYDDGTLSKEWHYTQGVEDGTFKRWNKKGELIGSYVMKMGTGVAYEWMESGVVWAETSYADGEFTGPQRFYDTDGKVTSEKFYIKDKQVSRERYMKAAAKNPALPKYESKKEPSSRPPKKPAKKALSASKIDKLWKEFMLLVDGAMKGEANVLDRLKLVKEIERWQMKSPTADPPSLYQFWVQPHGADLIFIEGDVVQQVPATVYSRDQRVVGHIDETTQQVSYTKYDKGQPIAKQRVNKMTAFPAHAGTLLSRRRRTSESVTLATWFSEGWTKVYDHSFISHDARQIGIIARDLGKRVVAVSYGEYTNGIPEGLLIEASANGQIVGTTSLDSVVRPPKHAEPQQELEKNPAHAGLAKALRKVGIKIEKHVLGQVEMVTILNMY